MLNYYVSGRNVYGDFNASAGVYPLLRISVDENGAYTVAEAGGGVTALPAEHHVADLWEVARMLQITPDSPYEPLVGIDAPSALSMFLDEGSDSFLVTASPAEGSWANVASSDTDVLTVSEDNGLFTLLLLSEGTARVTATWVPTDADYAGGTISVDVTVEKREVVVDPIRDYQIVKGSDNTVDVPVTIFGGETPDSLEAYTSDGAEVNVTVTGAVITLTPADAIVGTAVIDVYAIRDGAETNAIQRSFNVEVCAAQTAAFAVEPAAVPAPETNQDISLTFVPATGASILSFATSDPAVAAIQSYNLAAGTVVVRFLGAGGDTAEITATAQKRGYGQRVSGAVLIGTAEE